MFGDPVVMMSEYGDVFEEVMAHEAVVAYEDEDEKILNILKTLRNDGMEVNLGESHKLKTVFMEHFGIKKLPVILSRGFPILDGLEEFVHNYLEEKNRLCSEKILETVDQKLVTIFIKGTLTKPKCRFTSALVGILCGTGLTLDKIKYFDILEDESIRVRLKEINDWPTFPQVYIKGRFVGGLDTIKKMDESGRLKEELAEIL